MSDWEETTLGEVCEIEIGGTPSRSEDSYWWKSAKDGQALPWVSISDMKEKVVRETKESITEIGARNSNCKHVTKGTLLMSFKLTIGRLAFAGRDLYTNEAIAAIRPRDGINPEFIYYGLQYWNLTDGTDQAVKGVTLNKQKLQEIRCSIPPLPEQKKIAEILFGIDRVIARSVAASRKISTLSKAVLEAEKHKYAKGSTHKLCDVCELITKGATPTTYGHKLTTNRSLNSVSFLGGGNASPEGRFIYGPERFCSQEATRPLRRSDLKEGDSLVTIVGYVGNTCIIPREILPANINQNIALVRADERWLHHQYLHLFLRTDGGARLAQIATTQAQPSVSLRQVGDLEIYLPSAEAQINAIKLADSFSRKESQLARKIESLRLLKAATASDLLSGRRRVSV